MAGNEEKGIGGWEVLDHDSRYRPTAIVYDEEVAGVGERVVDYNQDNKPTHITYDGGTTTELTYDGEGNRIKKVQGSETVIYVGEIYEIRNGEALSYIYADGKKVVTLITDDDHEYYTHTDHLGSTTIVTDENGTAVEEIGYLPFGATLFRYEYNGSIWESAYKFTGQEFDPEYHLYNYKARLYDPIMGRFITSDTIVPDYYDPQSLNRYSYCLNNPLVFIDPSGSTMQVAIDGSINYIDDDIDRIQTWDYENNSWVTVYDIDEEPLTEKVLNRFTATLYAEGGVIDPSQNEISALADAIVNRAETGSLTILEVLDYTNSPIVGASSSTHDDVFDNLQGTGNTWVYEPKVNMCRLGVIHALDPNAADLSNGAHFWESTNFLNPALSSYDPGGMFNRLGWGTTIGTESNRIEFITTTTHDTTVFMNYNPTYYGSRVWP